MLHIGARLTTRRGALAVAGFSASFSAQVAHDASAGLLGFVSVTGAQGALSLVDGEVFGVAGSGGGIFTVTESSGFILVDFDRVGLGDLFQQGQSLVTGVDVRITDTVTERTVPLRVTVARANTTPLASGGLADLSLTLGDAISPVDLSVDFADPGDVLSFAASGVPAGLSVSGAGLLNGTPTEAVSGQIVTITATDSIGQQAQSAFQVDVVAVQSATTDPNVNAIGVDGWRVDYTAPGTFDPVGDPRHVVVERSGFDASGSPVTVSEALLLTTRVRQPLPNEAQLTASDVAMSDFVYAGDVVTGVTNGSTKAYPKPQAMWLNHDCEHARAASHTVRLAVAHAHARSGRPVAAVRFTASDLAGNTSSVTVSSLSVISYAASGLSVPHFAADLNLSTLNAGEVVTVDAEIFPWVGEVFTLSTDADAYPSPNLTVLKVLNDFDDGFGTMYAYVDGVGGSSAVNADPAAAEATPFASVPSAAAALQSFNAGTFGRANTSGGIIRLQPGVYTHATFSSVSVGEVPLVVEAADSAQVATTVYQDAGGSTSNGLPDKLKFRNLTLRRNATGNAIFLDNSATSGSSNMLVTEGCVWDDNGLGPSWGAWVYRVGRFWNIDCAGVDCAQTKTFSSVFKAAISIGSTGGSVQSGTYHAAGCRDLNGTFEINAAASNRPASVGDFLGFSHVAQGTVSERCVNFEDQFIGERGAAIVGCVLEQYAGTTGPCLYVSADGDVASIRNVVIQCNTVVGSRSNLAYQDTGTTRVDKTIHQRFCVHFNRNTKSDVFGGSGNLVGNWPVIHQVGTLANAALTASSNEDTPGIGSWLGEIAGLGDVHGTSVVPLEPDWADDRSFQGSATGNGLYLPGVATELPLVPAGAAPYSHDHLGKAIPDDGTGVIGALQA